MAMTTTKKKKSKNTSIEIGKCYLFRSVTYHQLGRVVEITDTDIRLADASWVADSGRFSQALATGALEQVEVCDEAIVFRGGGVDAWPWKHPLPTQTK
jgi:hypothetical protein